MKNFRLATVACLLAFLTVCAPAETRAGSDVAAPAVASHLQKLPLKAGMLYTLSDDETMKLIGTAADSNINIFELIDCANRYMAPRSFRIAITGDSMRKVLPVYDLGKERVLALLPVDKMSRMETGAVLVPGQAALDVFLAEPHEAFIEIGTAIYSSHFGFSRIAPLLFSRPFGIEVKKLFFSAPLDRLELYQPGKGAIYAKGLSKPKRWNLWIVTKL